MRNSKNIKPQKSISPHRRPISAQHRDIKEMSTEGNCRRTPCRIHPTLKGEKF